MRALMLLLAAGLGLALAQGPNIITVKGNQSPQDKLTPEAWAAYTRNGVPHAVPGWATITVIEEDAPSQTITRVRRVQMPVGMVPRSPSAPGGFIDNDHVYPPNTIPNHEDLPLATDAGTQRTLDLMELHDLQKQEKQETQATLDAFRFMQHDVHVTPILPARMAPVAHVPPFLPAPVLPLASNGVPFTLTSNTPAKPVPQPQAQVQRPIAVPKPAAQAAVKPAANSVPVFKKAITPSLEQQQKRPVAAVPAAAPAPASSATANLARFKAARPHVDINGQVYEQIAEAWTLETPMAEPRFVEEPPVDQAAATASTPEPTPASTAAATSAATPAATAASTEAPPTAPAVTTAPVVAVKRKSERERAEEEMAALEKEKKDYEASVSQQRVQDQRDAKVVQDRIAAERAEETRRFNTDTLAVDKMIADLMAPATRAAEEVKAKAEVEVAANRRAAPAPINEKAAKMMADAYLKSVEAYAKAKQAKPEASAIAKHASETIMAEADAAVREMRAKEWAAEFDAKQKIRAEADGKQKQIMDDAFAAAEKLKKERDLRHRDALLKIDSEVKAEKVRVDGLAAARSKQQARSAARYAKVKQRQEMLVEAARKRIALKKEQMRKLAEMKARDRAAVEQEKAIGNRP